MNDTVNPAETTETVRQLVVFTLDTEKYAAPIAEVREVIKAAEVTPVPGSPEFIVGVVNLRGNIIPVLDMEKLFHLERQTAYPALLLLLIIEQADGNLFAVRVDQVAKISKVLDKDIQPAPAMVTARIAANYVEGVVVTEDPASHASADVILLLSLRNVIDKEVVQAVTAAASSEADHPQTIETKEEQNS
jgi:purine-binding chemotaxis protein CheW